MKPEFVVCDADAIVDFRVDCNCDGEDEGTLLLLEEEFLSGAPGSCGYGSGMG
jgi:hypothetical protein